MQTICFQYGIPEVYLQVNKKIKLRQIVRQLFNHISSWAVHPDGNVRVSLWTKYIYKFFSFGLDATNKHESYTLKIPSEANILL